MNEHVDMSDSHQAAAPAPHAGAAVEYDQVAKHYGAVTALHPTSLTVEPGEFFAIIGPSGSGKSTLLGITAGFVAPSAGEIRVDGRGLVSMPPYRRNIGMVFQNYALFPHMTVAENIAFPLKMRGASKAEMREKVSRMLAMVRLEDFEERRPAELSGGQQQRVALGRAAVYDPLLLLMDEPLGALDKNLREEMQEEIKRFQAALGATVIYVTHDQQEAAYMADRVAIMRAGRIEQLDTPRVLYERPDTLFVASFLGEASILPIAATVGKEGDAVTVRLDDGAMVRATASREIRPGSAICLRPENVVLGPQARGLDNCFEGLVEDAVYTAGTIRYRVRLARHGSVLLVRVPSRLGISVMSPGESVDLGWSSRDALVVSGE